MNPDINKALELSAQYGVSTVILFMMSGFLATLVMIIIRQNWDREKLIREHNKEREEKLADIIQISLKSESDKNNERHIANLQAMNKLSEADEHQRREHKALEDNQNKTALLLTELLGVVRTIASQNVSHE